MYKISTKELKEIDKQGVSIVMGARDEEKTIGLTIGHLMEECYNSGLTNYEIILMDNGSEDETSRFFAWRPIEKGQYWQYIYSPRGMVNEGKLRIFYDPVFSNVGTRNKGVNHAKYENIIFADAHIITRPGTILSTINALNRHGGIIHCPVSWLGSSSENPSPSFQYSYKVGEKIWGTWNRIKVAEEPFYISISGHCWLGVKKKEFIEKRGYPYAQRVYGGGEPYLDTKWWMTGSTSMCDPRGLVYHLSAGRGYSWNNNDLIHNMFLVSYILGGEEWADRILITYLNKSGTSEAFLKMMHAEAMEEGQADKDWLDANKIMGFEDLLGLNRPHDCERCTKRGYPEPHTMRLWDKKNNELHGNHRSYVQEFRLEERDGKIYIGNTQIVNPEALQIANKYL